MNKCGECNICCSYLEIKALGKKKHTECENLSCDGCQIYENRPKVCEKFECAYIANNWSDYLRPDKCGVLIANFSGVYGALRLRDNIDLRIMDQIKFMSKKYGLRIEGIDARVKT